MKNVSRLKLQMTNSISQMFGVNSEKTPTQADFKFLKESLSVCASFRVPVRAVQFHFQFCLYLYFIYSNLCVA
jgi:hypothetical protein